MYYMCIYTCTYKEREGGEGESMLPLSLHTDMCVYIFMFILFFIYCR